MRNNLTASMFDLSMKDKPKTPFGKLKDKMKVKKLFDMESSSAIVPSNIGRLESDDEDEKKPKSKAALFLKGRLRKGSLTKSNTSLGSDSTISSTSGTAPSSAGISIVLPDFPKKPAARNSSLSSEPSMKDIESSPRLTHKRAFSDEVSQLSLFPEPKAVQNLKQKSSPISKSSVCINGSHVYSEVSLPKPSPNPLEKIPPVSKSFQNISKKAEEFGVSEKAGGNLQVSEKQDKQPTPSSVPALEELKSPPKNIVQKTKKEEIRQESKPVQITTPMVHPNELSKVKHHEEPIKDEKKQKTSLFYHETNKHNANTKNLVEPGHQVPAESEEKVKSGGWFGVKDTKETPHKPSFPCGPVAPPEANEKGSSLVERHSLVAFSPSPVDQQESLHKDGSLSLGKVLSGPCAVPVNVSEWEDQFDEFASSRLQPSVNKSALPETNRKGHDYTSYSPNYLIDNPTSSQKLKENVNVEFQLHTSPPAECLQGKTGTKNAPESSPVHLQCSDDAQYSLSPLSARMKPADEVRSLSDRRAAECERWQNSGDPSPVQNVSVRNRLPPTQSSCLFVTISSLTPTDFVTGEKPKVLPVKETKQKIVTASPTMEKSSIARNADHGKAHLLDHDPLCMSSVGSSKQVLDPSCVNLTGELQLSTEIKEGMAYTDYNSNSLFMSHKEPSANKESLGFVVVNGLENSININTESTPPPKPRVEINIDKNHKQTFNEGNARSSGELGNGLEEQQENNRHNKHIVHAVSPFPVIEIESPVQASVSVIAESDIEKPPYYTRGENDKAKLGVSDALELNESSVPEQFQTCPSKVSLDTLDNLETEESSDKLKSASSLELMNAHRPKRSVRAGNVALEKEFNFLKPVSVPQLKSNMPVSIETAHPAYAKRTDQSSLLFLSAVEEQFPNHLSDPDYKQGVAVIPLSCVHKECDLKLQINPGTGSVVNSILPVCDPEEDVQADLGLSKQSTWSGDVIVDFKNEDFWRSEYDLIEAANTRNGQSPGNPFTPIEKTPFLSTKNPFVDSSRSPSSDASLPENASFKDLHAQAAHIDSSHSALPIHVKPPFLHGGQPLAFSTPSFVAAPNTKLPNFPSPIMLSATSVVNTTATTNTYSPALSSASSGEKASGLSVLPRETQPTENPFMPVKTSPHPVKPISATVPDPEKKPHKPALSSALSSGLEMLKSVTSGQHVGSKKQEVDRLKDFSSPDLAAKYYHLTHDELITLLLQREFQLDRKEEHVRELEDYIDQLLVRIMDQAPTLLQVPLETKRDNKY
ncbi:hypothetical protein GDO86_000021 [Hymenochirus boettgeri]|nr:hypothetical protein GDO86_000021 [Hymenochirus boettgeri]